MNWYANPKFLEPKYFEIKFDPSVGFYLYVYDGKKCVSDHLQDTFEKAIQAAWEDYGVPKKEWKNIENKHK